MQQEERNKTQEYSEKGLQPLLREVPWEQWASPWGPKGQPNDCIFYTASTTRAEQSQQAV